MHGTSADTLDTSWPFIKIPFANYVCEHGSESHSPIFFFQYPAQLHLFKIQSRNSDLTLSHPFISRWEVNNARVFLQRDPVSSARKNSHGSVRKVPWLSRASGLSYYDEGVLWKLCATDRHPGISIVAKYSNGTCMCSHIASNIP